MSEKRSTITLKGLKVQIIEREETTINYWRSIMFFYQDLRILELSQDTNLERNPLAFVWREATIIPSSNYFRTVNQQRALVATVKYAAELADKWNVERLGEVVPISQPPTPAAEERECPPT